MIQQRIKQEVAEGFGKGEILKKLKKNVDEVQKRKREDNEPTQKPTEKRMRRDEVEDDHQIPTTTAEATKQKNDSTTSVEVY